MSTHATEAIMHASQGGVARGDQVHGKRAQPAQLGKIASAGFAQILGEQVAKSTVNAQTDERPGQRLTPHDVSTSSPHATPNASEKTTSQLHAQVRLESGEYATADRASAFPGQPPQGASADRRVAAQRVRTETSQQQASTVPSNRVPALARQAANPEVLLSQNGEASRTVGQETQPIEQPTTQPIAIDSRPNLSTARPDSSATNAQPTKPTPAANPSTRVAEGVQKFAGQTENPAKQTLAPASEQQSMRPAQAQVAHNNAHATDNLRAPASTPKATETVRVAQASAQPFETASPQPVVMTEVSQSLHASTREGQDLPHGSTAVQLPVNLPLAPSPALTSTPIREQIAAQIPSASRVPTQANERVATMASNAGENTVHAPVQTSDTAVHAQPAASDNSHRLSTKANETAAPAAPKPGPSTVHATVQTRPTAAPAQSAASEVTTRSPAPSPALPVDPTAAPPMHATAPTSADKGVGISTQTTSSEHGPVSESIAHLSPRQTTEKIFATSPAARLAQPVAASLAANPTVDSEGGARVVVAPQAQEPPRPIPVTASRATAPANQQHAPTHLPPEAPAHDQKEGAPVRTHAHTDQHAVMEASPPQEQKPEKRPDDTQSPVAAQAPSHSIPQPSPAPVAQESSAPHVARNPEPASPPETASPVAPAKASTKAAIVRPTTDHPSVLGETKPTESTSDVKTPEPNANHVVPSSESTARTLTDKPAPAYPKHAEASPAPQSGHAASQSPVHAEPVANKRRTRVENEKKQEDPSTDPAKPAPTNLQASPASPNEGMEVKAAKPEAPKPTEHSISTETSSQTSSAQSQASQPHTVKEAPPPLVLPTAERTTVFVSPNTFLPATGETGARESQAPATAAAEASRLVDQAVEDPGLSVNVMPHSAHLSITGDAGDLSLHVRVRDGSADVNVSGTMAPLFDTKAPEMRTALAGEGLQLGSFATDQRGGSQAQQGQPESTPRTHEQHPMPTQRRTTTSTPEVQIATDRRIHVTA